MLAVRAVEMRQLVADVTEQFLTVLPDIKQSADKWLEHNEELKSIETRLQECHQQMALIKEIEAYGPNLNNHPLYAISQKYTSYKQAKNAVEDSMKALVKILTDFDTQIENFAATTEALNGPQLVAWVQEFSAPGEGDDKPIFEHIKEFLSNAGQSPMVAQCEQAEAELNQSMQQTGALVRSCLELLSQYVAVAQYYPRSRTEYHRVAMFRKCLATALESRSPEVCREVAGQVTALVDAEAQPSDHAQQIVAYNHRLQAISAEAAAALSKCSERLQAEGGHDAIALAEEAYKEAKVNIGHWVRTEEGAAAALESVVIGVLCNLNRRYLMLENGAQSAGDCLVDYTSREGEWFLDDMSSLSMQAVELLSLLPLQSASAEDAAMPAAVECVRNANLLLADLVQLNYNFSTIILPEMLKKIHSEDPSMLLMMNELNAVIMSTPIPLNELLAQLEMHLRYLVMDMESPASNAQLVAGELRARYEALVSPAPAAEAEGHCGGRMLLMGLNGLFAAVEARARTLAEHLATPVPAAWRKIDHISEALHMSAALQSSSLRSVLEAMFLVRRVQAVGDVLALAAHAALAFGARPPPPPHLLPHDDAALCKPIRRFTAEYVSRCVLGVPSRALAGVLCLLLRRARLDLRAEVEQKEIGASWSVSLESLCEKARSCLGAATAVPARQWERALALAAGAQQGAARLQRARQARRAHQAAAAACHTARARLNAHTQLHIEVLGASCEPGPLLWRRARDLSAAADRLRAAAARAHTLVAAAHQRVVWGAGANPALKSLVRTLEALWRTRRARCVRLAAAAGALTQHARRAASMRHRQRQPSQAGRRAHSAPHTAHTALTALAHWEKACTLAQKYALKVSPVEESLMEMLHPEGNIDTQWVENVSALLREMISSLSGEVSVARARVAAAGEALRARAAQLAGAEAARAALQADVRAPLSALQPLNDGVNPASEYVSRERAVSELVALVAGAGAGAVAGDGASSSQGSAEDEAGVAKARHALHVLTDALPELHDMLLELPTKWSAEWWGRKLSRQPAAGAGAGAGLARRGGGRNAVGAGVWRRVRLRLEGRDPDCHAPTASNNNTSSAGATYRASPHEQVEYIISEATSAENLCMMYEGWMSWV